MSPAPISMTLDSIGKPVGSPKEVAVQGVEPTLSVDKISAPFKNSWTVLAEAVGEMPAVNVKANEAAEVTVTGPPKVTEEEVPSVPVMVCGRVPLKKESERLEKAELDWTAAPDWSRAWKVMPLTAMASVPSWTFNLKVNTSIPLWPSTTVERTGESWTTFSSWLMLPFMMETGSLVPVNEAFKSVAMTVCTEGAVMKTTDPVARPPVKRAVPCPDLSLVAKSDGMSAHID